MAMPTLFRRRHLLVNRDLQFRFTGVLLLQMSLILASLALVVHSHVTRVAEAALSAPIVDLFSRLSFEKELIDNVHGFYLRSLILLAVTATAILFFGLIASHRLAGPVHKLERFLLGIADGDVAQRIAFRRHDHLDEFAATVNEMTESLARRRERCRELAAGLLAMTDGLESPADRPRTLSEMEKLVSDLREAV